jgi:hypothetical protein
MSAPELGLRIAGAFARLDLVLTADGPDRWRAELPPGSRRPPLHLEVLAEAEGRVLSLHSASPAAFGAELRGDLLEAVNHWHLVQRWPRLYVNNCLEKHTVEADAHLVVDSDGALTEISGVVTSFISGCVDFWEVFDVPLDRRAALEAIGRIVDRTAPRSIGSIAAATRCPGGSAELRRRSERRAPG